MKGSAGEVYAGTNHRNRAAKPAMTMEKIMILSENFLIGIFLLMLLGICMTDHIFNHQIHGNKHTEKGAYDGKQW